MTADIGISPGYERTFSNCSFSYLNVLSESIPYRSRLAVGSRWYDIFFNRWKVVFREVFLIIKVKLVGVQAKHAHHGIMPCPLRLYHHFVQGLLHCYMVLVTKRVMYGDIF